MGLLGLFFAFVAVLCVAGVARTADGRIKAHGLLILLWRWHTGHPWHGSAITNAGWFRKGQGKALTRTGFAPRFHFRPRWERTVMRCAPSLALVLAVWGMTQNPQVTVVFVALAVLGYLGWLGWRATRAWRRRQHRRTWIQPAHVVLSPLAGIPIADPAEEWLSVTADRSRAVLTMGPGFDHDPRTEEQIVRLAGQKLGMESPDVAWRRTGPRSELVLTKSEPPPSLVTLDGIIEAITKAGKDELVTGIGKRGATISADLHSDSPHLGISMGSGGGKSNLAAFWLVQELMRGAICLVLDAKWISHPWLIGLPNVAYCRTAPQIHAGLVWLSGELDRRNKVALRAVDAHGKIHANVGPRLIVVCEELNLAMPRLKSYWAEIRGPGDDKASPALTGLGEVAFAGRQARMHLMLIGQSLTAASTGSRDSSVRENVGCKALARYSKAAWQMQAPEHAMPPRPSVIGRVQLVTASGVREVQTPKIFDEDPAKSKAEVIREMATAGILTPCPAGMPGAIAVTHAPQITSGGSDLQVVTVTGPPGNGSGNDAVTIAEAIGMQITGPTTVAVRVAMHRDRKDGREVPRILGQRGTRNLFDPAELAEWEKARRS